MERIFQIKLSRIDYEDFLKFFDVQWPNLNCSDKYCVLMTFPSVFKNPSAIVYDSAIYRVYDSNQIILGNFRLKQFSNSTIISFYNEDKVKKQAFFDYIQHILEEMKLVGFTILETQEFGEDTITEDVYKRYKLPKRKADRKKWIDVYKCIIDYLVELSDSDEDEIFVPKLVDIRSYIKLTLNIEYSTKTISRIIKAGEAGLLDKH